MKQKKKEEKLKKRIEDYEKMVNTGKSNSYNGYKKPGSVKK